MKKLLTFTLGILLAGITAVQAQNGTYVRKQIKPGFFIPKSAEPQPENLAPLSRPQTAETPRPQTAEPETKTVQNDTPAENEKITIPTTPAAAQMQNGGQEFSETPEYQQKYQEYLRDLEYIATTGERPSNTGLDQDLHQMNSNKRIKVDENFNSRRNIKAEFEKTLNQSLQK